MISIGNLAKLLSRGSRILVGTLSIRARSSAREATLIYHRYHENCSADFTMFLSSMCFGGFQLHREDVTNLYACNRSNGCFCNHLFLSALNGRTTLPQGLA